MPDEPTDFDSRDQDAERADFLERELSRQSGTSLSRVRRSLRADGTEALQGRAASIEAEPRAREPQRPQPPAVVVTEVQLVKRQIIQTTSLTSGNAGSNGADGANAVDPTEIEPHNLGTPPATVDAGSMLTSGEVLVEDADPDTEPGINAKTLYALDRDLLEITDFNDERLVKIGRTVLPEDGSFIITGTRSSDTDTWVYQKAEAITTWICVKTGEDAGALTELTVLTIPPPP